jgi:hypothetical protein
MWLRIHYAPLLSETWVFSWQDIRAFQSLESILPLIESPSPGPGVFPMPTYTDAVNNSYTTSYVTGAQIAKADGEICRPAFLISSLGLTVDTFALFLTQVCGCVAADFHSVAVTG